MNEYYAPDTSKKIKSVFKAKGMSGKHLTGTVLYSLHLGWKPNALAGWWGSRRSRATNLCVHDGRLRSLSDFTDFAAAESGNPLYSPRPSWRGCKQREKRQGYLRLGFFHNRQYLEEARILRAYYQFQNRKHFKDKKSHYVQRASGRSLKTPTKPLSTRGLLTMCSASERM